MDHGFTVFMVPDLDRIAQCSKLATVELISAVYFKRFLLKLRGSQIPRLVVPPLL